MEQEKRSRPTWAMVRALEKDLSELKETYRLQLLADKHLSEEIRALKGEKTTLEQSNRLMEEELNRVKDVRDQLAKINSETISELQFLKSRNFFERAFNITNR